MTSRGARTGAAAVALLLGFGLEARPDPPSRPHDAMQRHLRAFRGTASLDVCLYTPSARVTARSRTSDAASRRAARAGFPAGPLASRAAEPRLTIFEGFYHPA